MSKPLVEDNAMTRSAKGLSKIMAVGIVLAVAAFGDVMYIVSMSSKFPSGLLLIFCYLGAFTSFLAVGYLLLGKSIAFRPGPQLLGAWIVFVVELAIIALNILMVFAPGGGGPLAAWAFISPATPVLHMLGVALLYFLDPDLRDKHANMEVQEKMDQAERDVLLLTHTARIELRKRQIGHVSKALEEAVNSPESLAYINQFGRKLNHDLLIEMTGMSSAALSGGPPAAAPGLPAPSSYVPSTGYPVSSQSAAASPYGAPAPASGPLTGEFASGPLGSDDWLEQVNDRIAAERAARLAAESDGLSGSLGGTYARPAGATLERMEGLAQAVQARGFSLEHLEQMFHLPVAPLIGREDRLVRLVREADAQGYSLDRLESMFGSEGGEADTTKK